MNTKTRAFLESLPEQRKQVLRYIMETFGIKDIQTIDDLQWATTCWDQETEDNIKMFTILYLAERLPKPPFKLNTWTTVNGPKFFEGLLADIKAGPGGPRARTGAIQEDLKQLMKLIDVE